MEEEKKEEKVVNTEELKSETSNTVNQVKDTIKNVDFKKDTAETKGFITEMFKNPLGKLKELVDESSGKSFKYAVILLVVWTVAVLLNAIFSRMNLWGYYWYSNLWSIVKSTIAPILSVVVMSIILFVMNKKNKKPLTTVITAVTAAKLPTVIASVVSLLTLIGSGISIITSPFAKLCNIMSVVLFFFASKNLLAEEENSKYIKKFVIVEAIFYAVYILLGLLGIYLV